MKEIPILFSSPMVQAILAFLKTMTRRLKGLENINNNPSDWVFDRLEENAKGGLNAVFKHKDNLLHESIPCPYGKPGDLIWVRESWQLRGWDFEDGMMTVKYATGETFSCFAPDPTEDSVWLLNKVERLEDRGFIKPDPVNEELYVFTDKKQPFLPSIHMPKDAARIWLQVTDIRVERLQEISSYDAVAEGCSALPDNGIAKSKFQDLWMAINSPDSWYSNPWVWAVSFKVLSTTGKPDLITK